MTGTGNDAQLQLAQLMAIQGRGGTEEALGRLSADDYVALHTLIHLYPHFIDKAMYREVTRVINGPEANHRQIDYRDGTPRTRHTASNIRITTDGPDRAFAYVYYTLPHQPEGRPFKIGITGTWSWRFEKINGVWFIAGGGAGGGAHLWGDLSTHLDPVSTEAKP